ncbi:MAG: thioredoxin [Candidatus Latescibacterota bacterium]|nr:thioredoxin [Candidatus Latescibacterota bacterium]
MADLMEFTEANFDNEVVQASVPVVVDVFATWCGPCKIIAPIIEEIAGDYQGRVKVGKLDADAEQKIAADYQVRGLPTVLFFKNGEVADSQVGAANKAQYVEKIEALL